MSVSKPSASLVRRLLASALALLAFAALWGCGHELTARDVDLDGRRVEVVEAGSGPATVVFEAGLGSDWGTWDSVASAVADHARVFAYSRPGYGGSEPAAGPRDATRIVEELRALLALRGHAPPYVLVGHSFGGTYMELFAKKYPAEVAGLVLVDPRHRDLTAACAEAELDGCFIPAAVIPSLPPTERAELEGFATIADEIRAAGGFGSYPVRVLTATSHLGFSSRVEALWESMLGDLADEAADGELVVFHNAGHYLQIERPAMVIDQIVSVLPAAR